MPITNSETKPGTWQVVAAVVFSSITLLFLMGLVVISLTGHSIEPQSRWLVIIVLALGASLSFNFIGGVASASGKTKFKWLAENPVTFKLGGGILVFFITLGLAAYLFDNDKATVPNLFAKLENESLPSGTRVSAFVTLRDIYQITDFSRRNLSLLPLPKEGWKNLNLTEIKCIRCDLSAASLGGVILYRANLTKANLAGANLRDAHLNGARLDEALLAGATLDDAMLRGGSFRLTNFSNASLQGAWLMASDFTGAIFDGAFLRRATFGMDNDWRDCVISGASFKGADLRGINTLHCVVSRPIDISNARVDQLTKMHR